MATINMHMKFEIKIPKQTWLMLRKPCHLQTDGQTDGRRDGGTDKVNPVYPPSNFVGRGYNKMPSFRFVKKYTFINSNIDYVAYTCLETTFWYCNKTRNITKDTDEQTIDGW